MKPFPTPNRRLLPLWLLMTCVAFAFNCNLSRLLAPPATPTPAPVTNLTNTPYPTYTTYPTNDQPKEDAPPLPTLAPTTKPPTQEPTSKLPPPPGGGSSGIAKSDLEVLKIAPVSTTGPGNIYVDIRNNGPKEFSGTLHVVCVGTAFLKADLSAGPTPVSSDENITITLGLGTGFFYTNLTVDPAIYLYPAIQCVVEVPDGRDPDTSNNSGALAIP